MTHLTGVSSPLARSGWRRGASHHDGLRSFASGSESAVK
jgi:hypothetical protein